MTWMTIRLELAETEEFPCGSPGRVYLLNVPLNDDGQIDAQEIGKNPQRATFRRFWPSEADETGRVVQANGGWILQGERVAAVEPLIRLSSTSLQPGMQVVIADPSGERLPFRVAAIRRLGAVQ